MTGRFAFAPAADAFVTAARPRGNFGARKRLAADARPPTRSYIRFNVQGLTGDVVSARLLVYAFTGSRAGFSARAVTRTRWRERMITFANAPALGRATGASGAFRARTWASVDVTSLVDGDGVVRMALTTVGKRRIALGSRESGRTAPHLLVTTQQRRTRRDRKAPTAPSDLSETADSETSVSLSWSPSSDNVGVAGYRVYAESTQVGTTTSTSYTAWALTCGTSYTFGVEAYDAAGNVSARSTLAAATAACPSAAKSGAEVFHTTPAQPFVDASGKAVTLLAVNVIPVWSDNPGQTWEQARYDQIRAKGFNAVRFILYWNDFEPTKGTFNETSLTTLDTAISRANAAGVHVILSTIHLWGPDGMNGVPAWAKTGDSVTTVETNGAGYLKMIASRYDAQPAVVAYDVVNEPHRWPIDQNSVLRMYDSLIAHVRTADADKIVLIQPTYGDTSVAGALADFSNLTQKANVVWSLHDYFAGGDDDGYDAAGAQAGSYAWDGTTGYASPNPAQLENHLLVHVNKMREVGLPIWLGEFGIGGSATNHDQWIDDKVAVFTKYGLGRGWWEYYSTGAFSALNADFTWKSWVDKLFGASPTPTPPPTDPVVVAAGDVACDPASGSFNGGYGTSTACRQKYTADLVSRINPAAVLMLGDAQYEYGYLDKFAKSYDVSWGGFKSKTWATAGTSHDFYGGGDFYTYFGARAGPAPYAPFSVDIGSWHVVSLNSGCENSNVGGCGVGSRQYNWLKNDLAANSASCTVAMWHRPRWTSGPRHADYAGVSDFVQLLYDDNAEVILTGHAHDYERYYPQTPAGTRDDVRGLVQFVVGTGGKSLESSSGTPDANLATYDRWNYGVLQMTLRPDRMDWQFAPAEGSTFAESGTIPCH